MDFWLCQKIMKVAGLPKQAAIKSEWTSVRISTHAGFIPRMGVTPHFFVESKMPNWCENRLSVSGPKSVIAELVKAVGLERGEFDFNGIVPMPAELHISKGSATSWGEDVLYGDWKRVIEIPWIRERFFSAFGAIPEYREEMVTMIEHVHACYEEPGVSAEAIFGLSLHDARQEQVTKHAIHHAIGNEWSVSKWGTKWNGGEVDVESLEPESFTIYFSTAWSPPVPVVEALCEKYPEIEAEMSYAETGCWFAGKVYGSAGCISDEPAGDVKTFCVDEFGHEFDSDD